MDSFSDQPAVGQPENGKLTSDSPKPPEGFHTVVDAKGHVWFKADDTSLMEGLDLAMLAFVTCLVGFGLTIEEAGFVVASELDRLWSKRPPRQSLVGTRWVAMA